MTTKILQLLEPTVGSGRVIPQVSIAMNFQQVEETVEQYDPNGSVIKSTSRRQDQGVTNVVGGIVSPRPPAQPTPGAPAVNGVTPNTTTGPSSENEVTNYEVSKSTRHIINPVGVIERLSVAVMVDNQSSTTPGADGAPQVKSTPRTPEDMKKYRDLVSAAIAINAERGDTLTVENMSFENDIEILTEPTWVEKQLPNILVGVRYLIVPIVFVLIYILFIRPVQKTAFAPVQLLEATAGGGKKLALPRVGGVQTPMTVRQLESRLENGGSFSAPHMGAEHDALPAPGGTSLEVIRKRVVEQAKADPETVARMVRSWLQEEKTK